MTALGSRDYLLCEISYLWDNGLLIGYTSKMYNYSEENGTTSRSFDVKIHYDEASEPYAVTLGEETYYYIRNAVGDVKGVINADTGEYVYALNTSAYGVLNFIEPDLTFDTSSLLPDQIAQIVQMMKKLVLQMCLCLPTANTYKGYSYDVFTGLYYLQSRYYDPEVGRFINLDDTGVARTTLGDAFGANLFVYCYNNPIANVDINGFATQLVSGVTDYPLRNPEGAWQVTVWVTIKKKSYQVISNFNVSNDNKGVYNTFITAGDFKKVANNRKLNDVAKKMYKYAHKKLKGSLAGRTEKGIEFELLCHYIIYNGLYNRKSLTAEEKKDLNKAKKIDIGSATTGTIGYDSNAKDFENKKSYLSFLNNYLATNIVPYQLYKIAKKMIKF